MPLCFVTDMSRGEGIARTALPALLLQQAEEEPLEPVVGNDVDRLDLVWGRAAHHLQIPVQGVGLGLDEPDLQGAMIFRSIFCR